MSIHRRLIGVSSGWSAFVLLIGAYAYRFTCDDLDAEMNLIEVDPILFVKCRLCLGETGQYQIVPNVRMQIKYCFEIDIDPFDGLPQLVCKNCKSILSQYTGIKQFFKEKQKILKSKLSTNSSNVVTDNIIQKKQNSTNSAQISTSSAQVGIENKNKPQRIKKYKRKTKVPKGYSATKIIFKTTRKKASKTWESSYTKYFVCRFCTKTFKDKNAFNNHIQKKCIMYTKYSNINKTFCLVELNKIGTKSNITGSTNRVVCNKYNIIESRKATYYILYKSKSEESNVHYDLSDSNGSFSTDNKKHKRQCLIKRTSTKSVESEYKAETSDDKKVIKVRKHEKAALIVSDIDCVINESFDSNSTKCSVKKENIASEKLFPEKISTIHDKMINNIIASRFNKYMNSLNLSVKQNAKICNEESSLKQNIANIEQKVIYSKKFKTTELLRSVEKENLEVVWLPKINGKVQIKTRSKGKKDIFNIVWENITSLQKLEYVIEDFALVFEKNSELEACVKKTSEDKQLIQADSHAPLFPNLKYETEDFAFVFEKLSELEACINKNNDNELSIQVLPQRQENEVEKEQEENKKRYHTLTVLPQRQENEIEKEQEESNKHYHTITHLTNSKKDEMLKFKKSFNNDNIPSKVPIYVDKSGCKVNDNNTFLSNVLNTDRQGTKLLNANPVANPKKLPKKNFFDQIHSIELKNDSELILQSNDKCNHNLLHCQICTELLTPINEEQVEVDRCNKVGNETNRDNRKLQSTLSKIQCKPISELMSAMTSSEQNSSFGWAINNERQRQNSMMQTNDSNMVYLSNPQFTNLISLPPPPPRHQNIIYYPQRHSQNPVVNNAILNTQVQGPQNTLEHFELHYFDV